MEHIDALLDAYEGRVLSRRELVAALAAIAVPASAGAAGPQTSSISPVAQGRSLNHASLAVSDVAAAADFYQRLLGINLEATGVTATIDRNPANRTSGGDQVYFNGPDNCRIQLGPHGYQG
jgi:glyoxalase/bleomycin resistance protein/dioxygenase superfamily protein